MRRIGTKVSREFDGAEASQGVLCCLIEKMGGGKERPSRAMNSVLKGIDSGSLILESVLP